jgi:hypothetical protein
MTDEASPDTTSRRKRLATRRLRTRAVGIAVTVALIVLAVATASAWRSPDTTSAATNNTTPHVKNGRLVTEPSITAAHKTGPPRVISHADPMRLWIGGDSLAGSFGPALGQMAGATGVIDATIDYKVSSGLEDQGIRDWYQHATDAMASSNPDAIVFIIGTNDASIANTYDGNNDGVADWEADYRAKVDRMMATFVGGSRHRTVYWLGPPTLGDRSLGKGAYLLGKVMRSEAKKFAPDVVYVDTYKLFSSPTGGYARTLDNGHGDVQTMRISDGVHFSVDGAQYLSNAIWKLLAPRWDVAKYADPSQPIDYTIAQGSNDYVPGVGRYRPTVPSSYSTTTYSSGTSTTLSSASSTTVVSSSTVPVSSTTKPVSSTTLGTTPKTTPTTVHKKTP